MTTTNNRIANFNRELSLRNTAQVTIETTPLRRKNCMHRYNRHEMQQQVVGVFTTEQFRQKPHLWIHAGSKRLLAGLIFLCFTGDYFSCLSRVTPYLDNHKMKNYNECQVVLESVTLQLQVLNFIYYATPPKISTCIMFGYACYRGKLMTFKLVDHKSYVLQVFQVSPCQTEPCQSWWL